MATIKKQFTDLDKVLLLIDPGHGGNDNGCTFYNGTYEKDFVLKLSLALYNKLKPYIKNIVMTRNTDKALPANSRIALINKYAKTYEHVDGYSIHGNADDGQARGAEEFISLSNTFDKEFCNIYLSEHCKMFGLKNRGVKTRKSDYGNYDYYYLHRETASHVKMKIDEVAFGDNRNDCKILMADDFIEKWSDHMSSSILLRYGIVPAQNDEKTYIVQCGAFNKYENAVAQVKSLKAKGFNSFIKVL